MKKCGIISVIIMSLILVSCSGTDPADEKTNQTEQVSPSVNEQDNTDISANPNDTDTSEHLYNTLPSCMMIDGDCFVITSDLDEDYSDYIAGEISNFIGATDRMPEKNGDTNFQPFAGTKYAVKDGKYYLFYQYRWHELYNLSQESRDSYAENPSSREMPIDEAYPTGKNIVLDGKEYAVYKVDYSKSLASLYSNLYTDYERLYNDSDLIVKGKFTGEAEKETVTLYDICDGKYKEYRGASYNVFHIDEVIKGDVKGNDIKIKQNYFVDEANDRIITYSELTPMEKGSEWVYFLKNDSKGDYYYLSGDYTCRYPLNKQITEEKIIAGEYTPEQLGVYDVNLFLNTLPIYNELMRR
ncbi:MAG: hypothetical protein K6E47_14025 [Lachnospiraceae bacterium]|nr:hypothetical protein [Lachnospiraceae bacterium]